MELLVRSTDAPVPDSPGAWRRGDVVVVMPDGHPWGREELNPAKFRVVKRPGIAVRDADPRLTASVTQVTDGREELVLRRQYRLESDDTTITDKTRGPAPAPGRGR